MKKMPEKQKRKIRRMNPMEYLFARLKLQMACGMSENEANQYLEQAKN